MVKAQMKYYAKPAEILLAVLMSSSLLSLNFMPIPSKDLKFIHTYLIGLDITLESRDDVH